MNFLYVWKSETDIEFADFQHRLAMALCGDHPQQDLCLAALAVELSKELEAAVLAGKLPVKHLLTFGPEPFPVGNGLLTSRVMVSDIRAYVAERGISVAFMPEVVKQARIATVDPLLLSFPRHARVHYTDKIGSGDGTGIPRVGAYIDCENDRIKRQAEGYFTVDEAAQILADSRDGIDVEEMIQRMKNAVVNGLRLVRNPGDRLPIVNDRDFRAYGSMVKVSDVDAWLESQGVEYKLLVNEAAPTATESTDNQAQGTQNGSAKKWTPEKLRELQAFRAIHTMPETATEYGISEQRIRKLLPKKTKATHFGGLGNR